MPINPGVPLQLAKEITVLMETSGILKADGDFDQTKLDTIQENAVFIAAVEAIFSRRGLTVPPKVHQIIQALPLIGLFVH